jgi:hypothetical protein
MVTMTAKRLQRYVMDYDYEITLDQAAKVLNVLDDYCDYGLGFDSDDIQRAVDYVVNEDCSVFAGCFS